MTISSKSKLEFFNAYGLVFEDHFYLHRHNSSSCINMNNVKRIKLLKGREFLFNIIMLCLSFAMIYLSFSMESSLLVIKCLLYLIAVLFLVSSIFFKKYTYKILLITIDYHSVSIRVDADFIMDAKEIVFKINNKISSNSRLLKAI